MRLPFQHWIMAEVAAPKRLQTETATELDDLGISVLKSACSSEAKDLAVDWAELGLDALLKEGVLKDAPMLGTVVKICAMSKTIRDQLFVRKVWEFLRACPEFNELEKLGFVREHLDDLKKAQKLGDAIVLILDKLDDLEKAEMLAKMFTAFVRKHIDYADFRRLAAGIDRAFTGDLKTLVAKPPPSELNSEKSVAMLEPAGFVLTRGGESRAHAIGTRTDVSPLGNLFQKCMWEE
jgi:hypothetical protein